MSKEPSKFFTEKRNEKIEVSVSEDTIKKLKKWSRKAGLKIETLCSALISNWADGTGGVYQGTWSQGKRVVLDWPLDGHFLILKVPKGVK